MALYEDTLTDKHTGETVLIKSNDSVTFDAKKQNKLATWEKRHEREGLKKAKEQAQTEALKMTEDAQSELDAYKHILSATLEVDDKIDWGTLHNISEYTEYKKTTEPSKESFFAEVRKEGLADLIPYFKSKRIDQERSAEEDYKLAIEDYEKAEKERHIDYLSKKKKFEQERDVQNVALKDLQEQYENKTKSGVEGYVNLVIERSQYPSSLDIFSEVHFDVNQSTIVVDVDLPLLSDIPSVKEYKYVHSRKTIEERPLSKKVIEDLYNDVIYQIAIRSIHEVVESDYKEHIQTVVFNGWVEDSNKATGKMERKCVLSVQVPRDNFLEINLSAVNPKDCFSHFKGVSAGNLVKLAPVKPIMKVDTEDGRIVEADNVIDEFDEDKNLAAMDWQEFEVLVRDIIGKEFEREGCRVEVTQASRDQGVDALAFDEDPIRGGKYVIQAKRYNNLVGLGAVRDLYGTVVNEGAVKGILITTSYYGKESLEFAKDKPLTLINGEELLYMFSKHGYKFKIELRDKKKAVTNKSY